MVCVHAENALERLELLPPREGESLSPSTMRARGVGQAVGVPLVLALVVGTLVLLQVDVLPGPVAEQRHVDRPTAPRAWEPAWAWGRRRLVVVVMLLLVVVMLLLVMMMLLLVVMLLLLVVMLLLLLLLLGRRGASSRASHRLERRRDIDETSPPSLSLSHSLQSSVRISIVMQDVPVSCGANSTIVSPLGSGDSHD